MSGSEHAPVALISGGATGVGAATARGLAARGFRVAINYRRSADEAEATAAACRAAGTDVLALQGDVAEDRACRSLVARTVEAWGRLDVLVCSAGITQFTQIADFDGQNAEDFHHVFAVNAIGPYQLARAASSHLRASGSGAIVNVSSIAGQNGNGSSLAYIASKGALNSLTLALARLLAPEVRVNAVLPGLIE